MFRSLLYRMYPFASLSAAPDRFDNFVWIVWLLVVGIYVVAGAGLIWTPACYLLLGRSRLEKVCDRLEKRLGRCLLAGFGTIALVYAVDSTLSLMAMPGRALGVMMSALFWVMLVIGYAAAALWVVRMTRKQPATLVSVAVGAALIMILQVIPIVGAFFLAWFVLLGLGSVVVAVATGGRMLLRPSAGPDPAAPQSTAGAGT